MGPWRLCGLAPAGADTATERLVDGIEPNREGQEVAVVDRAGVGLACELAEEGLRCRGGWGFVARLRERDRRDARRALSMPGMVRINVPADVTPIRHGGTAEPGA